MNVLGLKARPAGWIALAALAAWMWFLPGAFGQSAPSTLSPGVRDVLKLTQAHLGDDVIITYIKNSGQVYNLSADDILYLTGQGVSQPVISALLATKSSAPAPAAPTAPTAPPESTAPVAPTTPAPEVAGAPEDQGDDSDVNLPYFQSQLTPSGQWIDVPGYGPCWQPAVAAQYPDWRPYCDAGHWIYTEDGWSWQSDYAWGEIPFHYGRWYRDWRWGWMWVPGYHWGPAWVSWRNAEAAGFCGWAPLPPGAHFEVGVGLTFNGRVGADIDFGLAPSAYVFVPFGSFWVGDYHPYIAPLWRADALFHASVVFNDYHFANGHFVVGGFPRDRMAALTHHEIAVDHLIIHNDRIARARDIQRVRSAEMRHEISHDEAARREQAVRQNVRAADTGRAEENFHGPAESRAVEPVIPRVGAPAEPRGVAPVEPRATEPSPRVEQEVPRSASPPSEGVQHVPQAPQGGGQGSAHGSSSGQGGQGGQKQNH